MSINTVIRELSSYGDGKLITEDLRVIDKPTSFFGKLWFWLFGPAVEKILVASTIDNFVRHNKTQLLNCPERADLVQALKTFQGKFPNGSNAFIRGSIERLDKPEDDPGAVETARSESPLPQTEIKTATAFSEVTGHNTQTEISKKKKKKDPLISPSNSSGDSLAVPTSILSTEQQHAQQLPQAIFATTSGTAATQVPQKTLRIKMTESYKPGTTLFGGAVHRDTTDMTGQAGYIVTQAGQSTAGSPAGKNELLTGQIAALQHVGTN